MKLDNISTEELLKELKRREELKKLDDNVPCMGINDDLGVESFVILKNADEFASKLLHMELRCRYNSQRNPEIFFVKLPLKIAEMFRDEKDVQKVGKALKQLSNYKKLF